MPLDEKQIRDLATTLVDAAVSQNEQASIVAASDLVTNLLVDINRIANAIEKIAEQGVRTT